MFQENELPLLGIIRGIEKKHLSPLIKLFQKQGIRYMEITMNTPEVEILIEEARRIAKNKMVIGAGTVLSVGELEKALGAGAHFIVSPSVQPEVIATCVQKKIPVFPGALTPTEVHQAWDMGASMVKLFPAGAFGPSYIKAVKGPFDKLKIIAVGGVNADNASEYLKNGADALAFGAGIVKPEWLKGGNFDRIEESLAQLVRAMQVNQSTI